MFTLKATTKVYHWNVRIFYIIKITIVGLMKDSVSIFSFFKIIILILERHSCIMCLCHPIFHPLPLKCCWQLRAQAQTELKAVRSDVLQNRLTLRLAQNGATPRSLGASTTLSYAWWNNIKLIPLSSAHHLIASLFI